MTTPSLNLTQFNAILRGSNSAAPHPTFTLTPYLTPEIFEGDVVDFSPGVSSDTLSSPQVLLDAISQGFGYTTVPGDAGKVLIVTQVATAAVGTTTTASSDAVTIQTPIRFKDLGFDGANVEGTGPASTACIYFNAVFDSRQFGTLGSFSGPSIGDGILTFSALSGTGVTATSNSTLPSLFLASDIGKTITAGGIDIATITGFNNHNQVVVTLNGALSKLSFSCWYFALPLDANGFPLTPSSLVLTAAASTARTITSAYIVDNVLTVVTMGTSAALQVNDVITGPSVLDGTTIVQQLTGNPCEAGTYQIDQSQFVGSAGSPVAMTITSMDGNLKSGVTYTITSTSRDPSVPAVISLDGSTTTGSVLTIVSTIGAVTTATLTFPRGGQVTLKFSQSISNLDIPYDGSSTSTGKGLFRPEALAHYGQFNELRLMDALLTNGNPQVNWNDRTRYHAVMPTRWGSSPAIEWWIAFLNAVYGYSGSKLKRVHWNLPGLCTVDYATHVRDMFTALLNPAIVVKPEVGNEPWNPGFALLKQWTALAAPDAHCLTNYGLTVNPIASVTANGTSTITVKTTNPLNTFVDPTTGSPYINNGATVVVENATSGIWNTPVSAANIHLGSPLVIIDATTFTYQAGAAVPAQTMLSTNQMAAWFNMASNLVADGGGAVGSLNFFNLNFKYGTRQTYLIQQQWKTTRPNDRFLLNTQTYGQFAQGGNDSQPIHFSYGNWLSSTYYGTGPLSSWLDAGAIAPYITGTSGTTSNSDAFWASVATNLAVIDLKIKGHVYACRSYKIRPVAYESGPDFSGSPAVVVQLHNDPRAGAMVTTFLDMWFKNGGEDVSWFYGSPRALVNGSGTTGWGLNRYYGEQSVKSQAFHNYATHRDYSSGLASFGGLQIARYRRTSPKRTAIAAAPNNGAYWGANTYDRMIGFTEAIPRRRRYGLRAIGTDVTPTVVDLWMDGVKIGVSTIPGNGAGTLATSVSGVTGVPVVLEIAAGGHAFEVKMAAGVGTRPSISGIEIREL